MRIRAAFASYGHEGSPIIAEIPAMFHDPSTHRHPQQNYSQQTERLLNYE